jgi:hypothetical protein
LMMNSDSRPNYSNANVIACCWTVHCPALSFVVSRRQTGHRRQTAAPSHGFVDSTCNSRLLISAGARADANHRRRRTGAVGLGALQRSKVGFSAPILDKLHGTSCGNCLISSRCQRHAQCRTGAAQVSRLNLSIN